MAAPAASSSALATLSRYGAGPMAASPAVGTPAARAKAASEDFEAVFLNTMFNQMLSGVEGDGPFGGNGASGVWRSFLADEYAKSYAKAGGVGIGAAVYRELLSLQEAKAP